MATKSKTKQAPPVPFLSEFKPMSWLWENSPPIYPSEHSARWAMKNPMLRELLMKANAVAVHRGRFLVHPERFAKAAEELAIIQAFLSHP